MRLIYFDIDTLRADHLGCYGYHRPTSPTIDALAAEGLRFDNVHASDTPCLPSRSALSSGQFGIRNGSINHGGPATDPFPEGRDRQFQTALARTGWMSALRAQGVWTASISTFAERHSAYHFEAGFNECFNLGTRGLETADQVSTVARDWLARNAHREDWFLHVHLWDPHTPYRTPASFGDPFADDAVPGWLTEDVRAAHWELPGPHSAQEVAGFSPRDRVGRVDPPTPAGGRPGRRPAGSTTGTTSGSATPTITWARSSTSWTSWGCWTRRRSWSPPTTGRTSANWASTATTRRPTSSPPACPWSSGGRAWTTRSLPVQDGLHYQIDVMATVLELCGASCPRSLGRPVLRSGADLGPAERASPPDPLACRLDGPAVGPVRGLAVHGDLLGRLPRLSRDHAVRPGRRPLRAARRGLRRSPMWSSTPSGLLHEWKEEAMSRSAHGHRSRCGRSSTRAGPGTRRVDVAWYLERLRRPPGGVSGPTGSRPGARWAGSSPDVDLDPTM